MSDGAYCHYCRKAQCVCHTPRQRTLRDADDEIAALTTERDTLKRRLAAIVAFLEKIPIPYFRMDQVTTIATGQMDKELCRTAPPS